MSMSKAKILIVEDESIFARDLELTLKRMGYSIAAKASSGEEAIKITGTTFPDLILMDIVLKGELDGIETANEILGSFDIPVIYLTAYTEEHILERAKGTIPYGYILKPVDHVELKIAIDIALRRHSAEKKKKELTDELALERIKTLEGCLSICASCKRIRDDKGSWEQLESFITQHCQVKFSHGLCPQCANSAMEEIEKY